MPESLLAPDYDVRPENLHSNAFCHCISAPEFGEENRASEMLDNFDFDSRDWIVDDNNEIRLITEPRNIIYIVIDSVVLETGFLDHVPTTDGGPVYRYFARLASRLTIICTAPMRFTKV